MLASCVSVLWWLLVSAAFVMVLLAGILHWVIVPRIGDWRSDIEQRLSHELGIGVRIGIIEAQSRGIVPSFELRDVRFVDAQGRDALQLKRVFATLSPRSLLRLGFEQLVIEQPALDIRRDAQGVIHVAGMHMDPQAKGGDGQLADWLFSQRELAIRGGTLRWTDELRGQMPVALQDVNLVLSNPGRQHLIQLDATPPLAWGERFTLVGRLRSPLLTRHPGRWQNWDGEIYAQAPRVDVRELRQYADFGVDLASGLGSGRVWLSIEQGSPVGVWTDLSLTNVNVRLAKDLQPLAIRSLAGRLSALQQQNRLEVSTEGLQFITQEGLAWPGGNLRFMQTHHQDSAQAAKDGAGELITGGLDLSALSLIADRLPLGTATHSLLASLKPQGRVDQLKLDWKGHYSAPTAYNASGKAAGLALASQASKKIITGTQHVGAGRPGFSGLDTEFSLSERGGKASIRLSKGQVELPGVFEDPVVRFDRLQANANWAIAGERVELKLADVRFANADAEGVMQASWHTADPAQSASRSRFPGVLDLQGTFSRAEGTRVHRYLPMHIPESTRHYVRDAVQAGRLINGSFKVKGDLYELPFPDPKQGEFRIAGQLSGVQYAYVPSSIAPEGSKPWPVLSQLTGELVFDRNSMAVNNATGRIGGTAVQMRRADARIDDLTNTTTVVVNADAQGALTDMLGVVRESPLAALSQHALSQASGSGNADLRLRLQLPLFDISRSKVQGNLTLAGNDVQITPDSPRLFNARGAVQFSENGFALQNTSARMLGGDVRLEGGTRVGSGPDEASPVIRAQGVVTADALRETKDLGFVSRLAQNASGSAAYAAVLGFRRGASELSITSNLQGMGLNLPAPLNKAPERVLPLRFENSLIRESMRELPGQAAPLLQDQWALELGSLASVQFIRELGSREEGREPQEPRVLRGGIAVGLGPGESLVVGDNGVIANINFARIDADAWERVIEQMSAGAPAPAANPPSTLGNATLGYLPTSMAIRAQELIVGGRSLNNVVLGGSREGLTWRANLDARELNGYVEFRQASNNNPGRVYARLARLSLAPSATTDVEAALEQSPQAVPALDIVVEDFELRGKKLGRVEVEAVNLGLIGSREAVREWRLNKLNVTMPEASFTASGNWAAAVAGPTLASAGRAERRRTVLNFKLDIANSGQLLQRFGFDKVVARGKGTMEGQLNWLGSPLALDYPSLSGGFNANIESGQFLKADPGVGKLLGVLSLQSLPRRLSLDFRDVFTEGFSFDFVRGDVKIDQGIASTNNLQMKGVNAAVLMEGKADIAKETQSLRVVVVPEINAGTASLVAAAINPAIGLGTFLAQLILRRPLIKAATQEFQIEGTWADPRISKAPRDSSDSNTRPSTESESVVQQPKTETPRIP
jgi:uncharacterized protein (TIGR02099 family)